MIEGLFSYKCHSMACHFLNQENSQLFATLCKIYDLRVSADTIFSVTINEKLNDNFNNTKEIIVDAFRLTTKYVKTIQASKQIQIKTNHIVEAIQTRSVSLVESIYNLYKTDGVTLEKIEEIECLNDLMITSLRFLNKISQSNDFFEIFNRVSRQLLVDVLLLNLLTLPRERSMFDENEKDFCEMFHDLCYEQKSETIKSYSMKLLENLCDKVDYFFSYCMTLVFSMMDHSLTGGDEKNWPALEDIKNSRFYQLSTVEDRVDVGLLVTSAVSFFLILRPEKL